MNFWNDKQLALKLKNNQVTSKDQLGYLMFSLIMTLLPLFFSVKMLELFVGITSSFYSIFGTLIAYKTNAKGDNKDFLLRYCSLTIVYLIRAMGITLFVIVPLFIFIFFVFIYFGALSYNLIYITLGVYLNIFFIYFFWRLNSAMKIASSQN